MKPMKSGQVDCLKVLWSLCSQILCVLCLSVNSNINRLAFMEMHLFCEVFLYI